MQIFFDGEEILSNSAGTDDISSTSFWIGSNPGGASNLHIGSVDEFRMSNYVRSDDWINMTYQVVASQTNLVSFGAEELNTDKGGIIPLNSGFPFYTLTQNPNDRTNTSCLGDMQNGESCNVTWVVNATGEDGTVWEFFIIANSSNHTTANNI